MKKVKAAMKKTHKKLMSRHTGKGGGKKAIKRSPAALRDMFEHMKK